MLLNQEPDGSGSFFYIAACLNIDEGCVGTNALMLEDRIAAQTVEIQENEIVVNYANRPKSAPMVTEPTEAMSKTFIIKDGVLMEKITNKEIVGTTWMWQKTTSNNDTETVSNDPESYTALFREDGNVNIKADCNTMQASYILDGNSLEIGMGATTLVMCGPESQDQEFLKDLGSVTSYLLKNGSLYLELMADAGNMVFSKKK